MLHVNGGCMHTFNESCISASGHEWRLTLVNIGGNEIVEMLSCGLCSVGDVHGCFRMLNIAKNSLTQS